MRFMMMLKANKNTETGVLPTKEHLAAMGTLMEDMAKAGVLLAADGLQPIKIIKIVALALVVLVAGVLVFAATKPDTLHVERTVTIKAPAANIFPLINDFHSWGSWSPYEKRDAAMKRTFSGAPSGKGAVYEWAGNRDVGSGRMEITDTTAIEDRDQARLHRAVRGARRRRVHHAAKRRLDQRHLEHAGPRTNISGR